MSCWLRISSALFFGWMSAKLLCLPGGGASCVVYHVVYSAVHVWGDRDVDIEYDAIQVNHNHEYRASVQANFVGYARLYHTLRNIGIFHVAYGGLCAVVWFGASCAPALGSFGSSALCFLCMFLPSSIGVRFVFVVCFFVLVRAAVESSAVFSWAPLLRSACFFACFVLDRLRCWPACTHFACAVLLIVFGCDTALDMIVIPAVAPIVFCREVLEADPTILLLSTVVFLSIIALNQ